MKEGIRNIEVTLYKDTTRDVPIKQFKAVMDDGVHVTMDYFDSRFEGDEGVYKIHHLHGDPKLMDYYWNNTHKLGEAIIETAQEKHAAMEYPQEKDFDVVIRGQSHIDRGFIIDTTCSMTSPDGSFTYTATSSSFMDIPTLVDRLQNDEPIAIESPLDAKENEENVLVLSADQFLQLYVESNDPDVIRRALNLHKEEMYEEEVKLKKLAGPSPSSSYDDTPFMNVIALRPKAPEQSKVLLDNMNDKDKEAVSKMLLINVIDPPEHEHVHEHKYQDDDRYNR